MKVDQVTAVVGTLVLFQFTILEGVFVEFFYFGACPGSFAEEFEAGLDGWVADEAVDADLIAEFVPAEGVDEVGEDFFECDAVKRIF
jgi:hypothetical protein